MKEADKTFEEARKIFLGDRKRLMLFTKRLRNAAGKNCARDRFSDCGLDAGKAAGTNRQESGYFQRFFFRPPQASATHGHFHKKFSTKGVITVQERRLRRAEMRGLIHSMNRASLRKLVSKIASKRAVDKNLVAFQTYEAYRKTIDIIERADLASGKGAWHGVSWGK